VIRWFRLGVASVGNAMRNTKIARLDTGLKCDGHRSPFDYGSVSVSVAKFLVGQADRIRRHCATSAVQIGKALLEAKRHLSHGEFLRWVECEVGIPARTAQAYMRLANWVSDKHASVAHLPPTILYLLSSTGTPQDFVKAVLERAESGETCQASAVREELKAFRLGKRQEYSRTEMSVLEPRSNKLKLEQEPAATKTTSDVVTEFVAILLHGLSAPDFARVREMMTRKAILSDPCLLKSLEQEFGRARADFPAESHPNISSSSEFGRNTLHSPS